MFLLQDDEEDEDFDGDNADDDEGEEEEEEGNSASTFWSFQNYVLGFGLYLYTQFYVWFWCMPFLFWMELFIEPTCSEQWNIWGIDPFLEPTSTDQY